MDIPFRSRGKPSPEQRAREAGFAEELIALATSLPFKICSRDWLRGVLSDHIDLVALDCHRSDLKKKREDLLSRVEMALRECLEDGGE